MLVFHINYMVFTDIIISILIFRGLDLLLALKNTSIPMFTLSTYSYDRIQPNTWSGAYLCWGKENREAPLRTACPPGVPLDLVSNFEIKSFDACANPHLGLAAIAAAGIDGLRRDLKLPEPIGMNIFYCLILVFFPAGNCFQIWAAAIAFGNNPYNHF